MKKNRRDKIRHKGQKHTIAKVKRHLVHQPGDDIPHQKLPPPSTYEIMKFLKRAINPEAYEHSQETIDPGLYKDD